MNNRLEWLANTPASQFNPLDYPNFKTVTGQPVGTSTYTAEELDNMGMVGVYRVQDFPNPDEPVLARIEKPEDYGGGEYFDILFYDDGMWWSLAEREPIFDGEGVVLDWRYAADCFAPLEEVNE